MGGARGGTPIEVYPYRSVPGRHPIYRQPAREASAPVVTPAARTPPQHPLRPVCGVGWCGECGVGWCGVGWCGVGLVWVSVVWVSVGECGVVRGAGVVCGVRR